MIRVEKTGKGLYQVTVEGRSTTNHQVSLSDDYCEKLAGGRCSPEALIRASFEFLLERESNTMILSRFELPLIQRYFPEYEGQIGRRIES